MKREKVDHSYPRLLKFAVELIAPDLHISTGENFAQNVVQAPLFDDASVLSSLGTEITLGLAAHADLWILQQLASRLDRKIELLWSASEAGQWLIEPQIWRDLLNTTFGKDTTPNIELYYVSADPNLLAAAASAGFHTVRWWTRKTPMSNSK